MMREINEHAIVVVVWLGPAQDDSLLTFEKMEDLAALYQQIEPADGKPGLYVIPFLSPKICEVKTKIASNETLSQLPFLCRRCKSSYG